MKSIYSIDADKMSAVRLINYLADTEAERDTLYALVQKVARETQSIITKSVENADTLICISYSIKNS